MYYATLCAIAKDEDPFIVEWLDYHLRLGFEHVHIYDNNSRAPLRESLRPYCEAGLATVTDWPLTKHPQLSAYMTALRDFGPQSVWMGFLDIDEFLLPKTVTDVRELFDDYSDYGGLAVHWKMFGSNGHKKRPPGGVIANYTTVVGHYPLVKSFVRTACVTHPLSPHHFAYKDGCFAVNEDGVPVASETSYHTSKRMQVNHYYYKSFEDFTHKMERGQAAAPDASKIKRDPREYEDFARQAVAGGPQELCIQELAATLRGRADPLENPALLLHDCRTSLEAYLEEAASDVLASGAAKALHTLRRCMRYHDAPEARLAAAKLHLANNEAAESLALLQTLLTDVTSPLRGAAYHTLVDYYRAMDDEVTARRLERALAT